MVDPKYLVTTLVAIPLVLLVSLLVFEQMSANSRTPFESTVTNETLLLTTNKTAYDCKKDSVTRVGNTTHDATVTTNYNITYAEFDGCTVTVSSSWGASPSTGGLNISYTKYDNQISSDYTAFESIRTQTLSGSKLGALVPYVLIAMAIITAILGGIGVSKLI